MAAGTSDLFGDQQPTSPKPNKPKAKKPSVYDAGTASRFKESGVVMGPGRPYEVIRLSPLTTWIIHTD